MAVKSIKAIKRTSDFFPKYAFVLLLFHFNGAKNEFVFGLMMLTFFIQLNTLSRLRSTMI